MRHAGADREGFFTRRVPLFNETLMDRLDGGIIECPHALDYTMYRVLDACIPGSDAGSISLLSRKLRCVLGSNI